MSEATSSHSLLISDLHLSDTRDDLSAAFKHFCEQQAANANALYILGDLSDAWIGDDDDCKTAKLIRECLKALTKSGVDVYLMTGNRDFLMGEKLAADCNLQLLNDPSVVDLEGQPTLLLHGDTLCTNDTEYLAFRTEVHKPETQGMFLSQSLGQRRELAAMLRGQSKSANANKAEDIMDVTPSEVIRMLEEYQVKTMIHGHTHRPKIHNVTLANNSSAQRFVLGDWGSLGWYIKASVNGVELRSFPINYSTS